MPIILGAFCLLPFLAALVIEYIVCRTTTRWFWKGVPPILVLLAAGGIGYGRYRVWASATVTPWTQLILFPGLPAVALLLGLLVGWRLWHRRFRPRVVKDQ